MDNRLDLTTILKGCEGITLYYTVYGECKLGSVNPAGDAAILIQDIKTGRSLGFLKKNGKKYDTGECLLFPSKNQRDWSKFEIPYKDGVFVVAEGRTCIFKEKDDDGFIDVYAVISRSDEQVPNKLFIRDSELQQLVKGTNMRLATTEEIENMKKRLADEGYEWDESRKKIKTLRWKPNEGCPYFYIDMNSIGTVSVGKATWKGGEIDHNRYSSGNVFSDMKSAEEWKNKFKEINVMLRNRK